jgi:hypothetical protein
VVEHVVMPGETLSGIAAALGTTVDDLLIRNPQLWVNPDLIVVGQKIDVPAPPSAPAESAPPPEIAPEQAPAPPVLRLTHRPVTATVQPCARAAPGDDPIDPLVLETLSVWDDEDSGKRYWDETSRTLHIVQTGPTDRVTIRYTGPAPPAALDVHCNGRLLDKAYGGGTYIYDLTYAPWDDPYANAAAGLMRAVATWQARVAEYRFTAPQFTVHVRVYNPDQWKLKIGLKPFKKQKFSREYSSPTERKIDTYVLAERRRAAVVIDPATGDVAMVAQVQRGLSHEQVTERETGRVRTTVERSGMFSKTTKDEIETSHIERSVQIRRLTYEAGLYVHQGQGQGHALAYGAAVASRSAYSEKIWNAAQSSGAVPATALGAMQQISLSRNGVDVPLALLRLIGSALAIAGQLARIIEAIQDTVPRIGWFFEMQWSVFAGDLAASWGWREHSDHRVYYEYGLSVSLTILSLSGKIGIGVSVYSVKCQAVLEVNGAVSCALPGAKVKVGLTDAPDREGPVTLLEFSGDIGVAIYVNVEAGSVVSARGGGDARLVQVKGKLELGAEGDAGAEAAFTYGEVSASFSVSVFSKFNFSDKTVLIRARQGGTFRFPSSQPPPNDDIQTQEAVAATVQAVLQAQWFPVRFYDEHSVQELRKRYRFFGEEELVTVAERNPIGTAEAARRIAAEIWKHRTLLDLRPRAVEGIVLTLRNAIETREGRAMSTTELDRFLTGPIFQSRLTEAHSPAKVWQADNSHA